MKQTNDYILGIVIKEEPLGEKSKLLHVLSSTQGIIKMKAPGANNIKSSTHSAIQLFTYSEFSYAKGRNGYLTITGATVKKSFWGIKSDVSCYALACYFSTAVEKFVVNDSTSAIVLRLVLNCLYALSDLKMPSETVKPFFEIKLASVCGFAPNLDSCSSCGNKSDTLLFDLFTSGLICKKCESNMIVMTKSRRFFRLSNKAYAVIDKLSKCDMKKMFALKSYISDEEESRIFRDFAEMFICNIFEYEPKTLSFYNHLIRSIENEKLRQKQKNT